MLEVYTIQMARWRVAMRLGIELKDITIKSGNKVFAPEYEWLMKYKGQELTRDQYSVLYRSKMQWSYVNHRDEWDAMANSGKIALACYCKPNTFCHRHLFKQMLIKHCEKEGIAYIDGGEIS